MRPLMFKSLITMVSTATVLWAAEVVVFPLSSMGLSSTQEDVIGELMAKKYAAISGKQVSGPLAVRDALANQNNDFTATAKSLGVTEYVLMSAILLDTKIIVESILYNQNGSEQFRASMTAITMDDMMDVTDRLARALIYRKATTATADLDNVTIVETQEQNRMAVEKIKGIKAQMLTSYYGEEFHPMAALGYNMRIEMRQLFLEFGANALVPANFDYDEDYYGGVSIDMGINYYPLNHPMASPYIGGGLNPRFLFTPGGVTMVPYVQAGVMLLRTSRMRLYSDVRIGVNALPVTINRYVVDPTPNSYGYYDGHDQKTDYNPVEIGLQIGIGW